MRTSSHQSTIRFQVQKTGAAGRQTHKSRQTEAAKPSGMRITIIRETQALRATAVLNDFAAESRDSINQAGQNPDQEVDDGLAYKDISNFLYYTSTCMFYGITVAGSCLIPSVDEIFEFVGVICVNCVAFMFPSIFYLTASRRYHAHRTQLVEGFGGDSSTQKIKRNKCLEACCYAQITIGAIAFVAGMFNNIHGLIDTDKGEH